MVNILTISERALPLVRLSFDHAAGPAERRLEVVMDEQWRPVVGFEKYYAVSNLGRVKRTARRMKGRTLHADNQILNPCRYRYLQVELCAEGKKQRINIHILACEAFNGPRPSWSTEVNHKNGNKYDNRPENLEWSNRKLNAAHAANVLGVGRGEKHGRAKLTEIEVLKIKKMLTDGFNVKSIGGMYGVSPKTIASIKNGKSWRHL